MITTHPSLLLIGLVLLVVFAGLAKIVHRSCCPLAGD
jgi:hypothetical protein